MRTDTVLFTQKNTAKDKRPRYVIELAFDSANTILWYFTSHADTATPGGASVISKVVEGLAGTSQTLSPDKATATIGDISFKLVDKDSVITNQLGSQIALGRSTRRQRVRVYVGYEGLDFADYSLVQTQLVTNISYDAGSYNFSCKDIQREMRKDIFDQARTTLSSTLSASATTVEVADTSAFSMVAHGNSYSDSPSATVGYIKIQDEIIKYTGKTSTQFTGCTRGALNTLPVEHAIDPAAVADRRTPVSEYIYLEMPAVKLMYALLTGVLHNQGGATLPVRWHLGIPTTYVRLASFTGIGPDLWDTANDQNGLVVRFEALEKEDGKKFIEEELALLTGVFMPIHTDGTLGLRRMENILAGASYVRQLDETNVVQAGTLTHDMEGLHNQIQVSWNYEPFHEDFTRVNLLIDSPSITKHGKSDVLKLEFRGLHGSRHSSIMLAQRFDSLRDRYSGPPLRLPLKLVPSCNGLEVGDVVRVRLPKVKDFVANGGLDRSFEIQSVKMDWITGALQLELFASSQAPGALAPSGDSTVVSNSWYTSQGTALSSVLTITGSNPGHVSAGGTINGNASMTATGAIFYYDGDLQIDAGITVNITGNVQLRIKGFLQNNGTINGKGNGIAGAAAVAAPPTSSTNSNAGTSGFIGSTEAGGGMIGIKSASIHLQDGGQGTVVTQNRLGALESVRGRVVSGANGTMPPLNLSWTGSALLGLPTDMRGSSGSSGQPFYPDPLIPSITGQVGGAGGAGGAALAIICRGFAQGVSAKIDLSGADGSNGASFSYTAVGPTLVLQAGSGAGGAPGALAVILDGASASATGLTEAGFVALQGKTPIRSGVLSETPKYLAYTSGMPPAYSMFVGTGDGTTFPLGSLSGARGGSRVQYVPNHSSSTVAPDPTAAKLTPPSNIGLSAGTSELLIQSDGTILNRIKITWTASPDARTAGYDIQYKRSADSLWISAPSVIGQATTTAWITGGIQDGVNHDVRIRSASAEREISDWLTISNFFVAGKTAKPSNVGSLSFTDPYLSWLPIADADRLGYIVRYQPGTSQVWESALPAHTEGYVTATKFDSSALIGGQVTFLVKAIDTSRNESTSVSFITVDLRPALPNSFFVSRQPDGTREFTWSHASPPADLEGYVVRYFLGTTSDWDAMTPMHEGALKASPFESNQLAAGTYTFAIKSIDWARNVSASALFITTTIGDPRIVGAIEDFKEEPTWPGTKTDCSVETATGWLVANNNGTWNSIPTTWDAWTAWHDDPFGTIIYTKLIDIGVKTKFIPLVSVTGDGTQTIEEQHSDDGSSYSSYAAVGPQVDARYIRIKVTLVHAFPKFKTMRIILSATPISEIIEDLATSSLTGGYDLGVGNVRLPITKSYTQIKKVDVTLQGVGAGWSWELIDKNTSPGPQIKIYNSSNNLADATIDATITGV